MIGTYKTIARLALITCSAATLIALGGCKDTSKEVAQTGYRGTGMVQIANAAAMQDLRDENAIPDPQPPAEATGPKASESYKNVQVLGNLSEGEFLRVMAAMTEWIAPDEGCGFCHNLDNLADDSLYTKKVARKMIEMTRHLNSTWKSHVAETGVTCYTCHRGQAVPTGTWTADPGFQPHGSAAGVAGKNAPARAIADTALQADPFTSLFATSGQVQVQGLSALSGDEPGESIQKTEATYSLMIHISKSLGVNCTYCHNSRAFESWDQSNPARVPAWHGIRMVRDINAAYVAPLQATLPAARLGPEGDGPKVACSTCHKGLNKPLGGLSMLKDYAKELGGATP